MTVAATPWLAAFLTAGLSFVVACVVAWRLPHGATPAGAAQRDVCDDVEARYEQMIAQLRDLAQQKHRLTPTAFAEEKQDYEMRAQEALSKLMAARQTVAQSLAADRRDRQTTPTMRFLAARPQLRGALWGAIGMGLVAFLWSAVQRDGEQRPSMPQPGVRQAAAPMAGAMAAVGTGAEAEEMKTLAERLTATPNDVADLLRLAHLLLRAQMFDEARTLTTRVLQLTPNDLEGLTHAAVLAASDGDTASADVGLDTVLKKDPTFAEAWFFRGMLALPRGDTARVEASFTAFLQHAPAGTQRDRVAGMLARIRQDTP